ncbi:hypothetical protein [Pseudooceanicola nanhaiensis]|uniref:hypothetical protein n=1 Tax=Pseudooceanicola nanhaiensis TaxID=375761 RepID=UPI001CD5AC9A|nr:hypothetical protein [Pseudooceanicola nanhaiensis]MCA0922509.1 hypothetical protein [Pseudooceanicola nanhaiensis]
MLLGYRVVFTEYGVFRRFFVTIADRYVILQGFLTKSREMGGFHGRAAPVDPAATGRIYY